MGNEGTHEAIRPTRPLDVDSLKREIAENPTMLSVKFTWAHFALYDMIFRRFMASQMRESKGTIRKYRMKLGKVSGKWSY